jgi:hypothetical protein
MADKRRLKDPKDRLLMKAWLAFRTGARTTGSGRILERSHEERVARTRPWLSSYITHYS